MLKSLVSIRSISSTHNRYSYTFMSYFTTSTTNNTRPTVGFVGLGNMGGHMAHNLLKNQHNLYVYDINQSSIDQLKSKRDTNRYNCNIDSVKSISELPELCDIIITMLPSSPHVRSVYTDKSNSIFSGITKNNINKSDGNNLLLIDSSTIDPLTTKDVAAQAHQLGCSMVDAPVSGGIGGAESGTLTFMVGGNESDYNRAKLILQYLGKNIVYCGSAGTGQIAKVCNNLALGIQMVAVAEGMNLGIKLGMDKYKLANIFNTSSARCWSSDTYNPVPDILPNVPASKSYNGGFATQLMKKDIGLALDAAKQMDIKLHLGELVNELYGNTIESGYGSKDFGSIYQYLKDEKK